MSSASTLAEYTKIMHSTLVGGVTIDVTSGHSGTNYPAGTSDAPVDNLADAKKIMATWGFETIFVGVGGMGDALRENDFTTYDLIRSFLIDNGFDTRVYAIGRALDKDPEFCIEVFRAVSFIKMTIAGHKITGLGLPIDLHHPDSLPEMLRRIKALLVIGHTVP
jgi:hypothetical protein